MSKQYEEETLRDQCLLFIHGLHPLQTVGRVIHALHPLQTVGHPCFACMPLLSQLLPTVEGAQTTSWLRQAPECFCLQPLWV